MWPSAPDALDTSAMSRRGGPKRFFAGSRNVPRLTSLSGAQVGRSLSTIRLGIARVRRSRWTASRKRAPRCCGRCQPWMPGSFSRAIEPLGDAVGPAVLGDASVGRLALRLLRGGRWNFCRDRLGAWRSIRKASSGREKADRRSMPSAQGKRQGRSAAGGEADAATACSGMPADTLGEFQCSYGGGTAPAQAGRRFGASTVNTRLTPFGCLQPA